MKYTYGVHWIFFFLLDPLKVLCVLSSAVKLKRKLQCMLSNNRNFWRKMFCTMVVRGILYIDKIEILDERITAHARKYSQPYEVWENGSNAISTIEFIMREYDLTWLVLLSFHVVKSLKKRCKNGVISVFHQFHESLIAFPEILMH